MNKIEKINVLNVEAQKLVIVMQELSQKSNLFMELPELLLYQEKERSLLELLEEARRAVISSQKRTVRSISSSRKKEKLESQSASVTSGTSTDMNHLYAEALESRKERRKDKNNKTD